MLNLEFTSRINEKSPIHAQQELAVNGFEVEAATIQYENGKTLFNGLYTVSYKGVQVAHIRHGKEGYTFSSFANYKPIGDNYKTENLSLTELQFLLDNIRHYYFDTDLSGEQLNVHQKAIVNTLLKRARRGANTSDLDSRVNQLKETWKANTAMIEFLNGVNTESLQIKVS